MESRSKAWEAKADESGTKMIVVNSPSNPLGAVADAGHSLRAIDL